MRLFGFSVDAGVICVRCLMAMFAITLVMGRLVSIGVADEKRFGFTEVVIIPWSTKDRTILSAGPINTFDSKILVLDENCEIFLDDKPIIMTDLKVPTVCKTIGYRQSEKITPNNYQDKLPYGDVTKLTLRSIRFDPLMKDEHRALLPNPLNGIRKEFGNWDIGITDYNDMRLQDIYYRNGFVRYSNGAVRAGPIWKHARDLSGFLENATDKQIVYTHEPWDVIKDGRLMRKETVPVTRIIRMVSFELPRVEGGRLIERHLKETYYYNPVTHILESSLHRDAYLLGAAPDEDIAECKLICEHYKKDWKTISGAERVWAYRLLQYSRDQQARQTRDREGWKKIALLGGIVWLASVAPSVPSIASPTSPANKEVNVTVLKTVVPKDAKLYWTQYDISDAINLSPWSQADKAANGNFVFKCNPKLPLWVKVNDGKAKRIELPDRDIVIERLP